MRIIVLLLVLLGLFYAVTLWRAVRAEARTAQDYPPQGEILTVDGVQIHAQVLGDGPDLVLLHGAAGNANDMTFRLAPALADRFRVIIFDRPGLGYSDAMNPDGATIQEQADILMKAARQLGADKPIVLGHSYGGAVALAWAVNHPDALSALIPLAAPSQTWSEAPSTLYRNLSSPIMGPVSALLITAFVSEEFVAGQMKTVFEPQSAPNGFGAHFGTGLSLRRDALRANAMQRVNLRAEMADLATQYDKISVPTFIVHGDADSTVGFQRHAVPMQAAIKNAELIALPGIGHMPHQVSLDDVTAAVDRAHAAATGLR
jgi:pimeloyl-ACP methyl ester carboxylesterase